MNEPEFAGWYSLQSEIGHGSTSQVFEAWDAKAGRRVAVKLLYAAQSNDDEDGFREESRKIAAFSHPNVVRVHDIGKAELGGKLVPYVAMEYVPGGDLMTLIEVRKRLPQREAAGIGAGVAAALAHGHARDVVHEDVKPQNVLLEDRRRAKLTDFNVVRALRPGTFSGTPRYVAPECLQSEAIPASDVYSLGVTLYQMVVGGTPFRGGRRAVMRQHATESPIPPRERSQITEELNVAILHCLEKSPSRRPTAAELEKRLRSMSRHPVVRYVSRSARLWARRRLSA